MNLALKDFVTKINGTILSAADDIETITITDGYVSDLLSDVMGNASAEQLWITIMQHLNTVAVASLVGIPAIVFARGIVPAPSVIEKAEQEDICLVSSDLSAFEIAGLLYQSLHS